MWYQWQKRDPILETQQTPHTLPSQESYGVYILWILEKIDRVIMAQHGMEDLSVPWTNDNM